MSLLLGLQIITGFILAMFFTEVLYDKIGEKIL
jgi:hypothetical protein